MKAQFPEKLAFFFAPARYKIAYGGRGGLKSWGAADALLILGAQKPLRILCARENMNSIAESVHHLLESRMGSLGLEARYSVEKARIIGSNGSEFIFAGLRHNVANIKSLEAVDIVWVEEAATVSKGSWETLIPTIRKAGSEIWVTFNPELETDDTYKRFILNAPPNAVVVKTDYRDAMDLGFFPKVLHDEMEHLKATDYNAYRHVWLGECVTEVAGAIFGAQLRQVDDQGRICALPIDYTKPVHTFWDLGFGDKMCCWFAQAVGGWYHVIDYMDGSGLTVADWIVRLQQRGYMYGADWLPHDGVDAQLHHRLTGDRTKSVEQLMRAAGRNVRVAAKMAIHDRLNAARTILPQCKFDVAKCADGVQGLRHYQWQPAAVVKTASGTSATVDKREPLHDWASHPSDAFCTLAVSIKQPMAAPVVAQRQAPVRLSAWS